MNEPKVIKVDPNALIHDPDNPNKMPPEKYAALVAVLTKTKQMVQPILVTEEDDGIHIVDGHHRTKASVEAGIKKILAVVWDGSEEMRKAFAIGMNHIKGELDLAGVQRVMADLHVQGWSVQDLAITGYSEQEITDLLKIATDIDPDAIMQSPANSITSDTKPEPKPRPLVIELTFANKDDFDRAKRGLRRAAGKGNELGEGLLSLIDSQEG